MISGKYSPGDTPGVPFRRFILSGPLLYNWDHVFSSHNLIMCFRLGHSHNGSFRPLSLTIPIKDCASALGQHATL